ncbi:6,7-dimethyl-8-ribityllumazine synthase [Bacteroidia bacterium]|nr:6,7-dimethyl-8-ribityllumazine synthase [Bacteroidia bacterium]
MASALKNLSEYTNSGFGDYSQTRIAIVVAQWNEQITTALLQGAYDTLVEQGVNAENILIKTVPGSFELTHGAQQVLEAQPQVKAVICLGCVIQGETRHFDFICQAVAHGLTNLSIKYNKPVIFGVLTTNTLQQAIDRAGGKYGNKGVEAAATALKMIV